MSTITWQGPDGTTSNPTSGDFNAASNWQGGVVPSSGDTASFGGTTPYTVTVNYIGNVNQVDTLSLSSNSTLDDFGGQLDVSTQLDNQGTVDVDDAPSTQGELLVNGADLTGGGHIKLSVGLITSSKNNSDVECRNDNNTISGEGDIEGLFFENNNDGVINADVAKGAVGHNGIDIIDDVMVYNFGLMEATDDSGSPGYLLIGSAVINGDPDFGLSGTIAAYNDATVEIRGNITDGVVEAYNAGTLLDDAGASLTGVTLAVTGQSSADIEGSITKSSISVDATAQLFIDGTIAGSSITSTGRSNITIGNATLDGVSQGAITLDANLSLADGSSLATEGSITNDGTVSVNGGQDATGIFLAGNTTLLGGGAIILADGGANTVDVSEHSATLTNTDNTISGNGTFGSANLTLNNGGTIDATGTSPLFLELSSGSSGNTGTLEATGGGDLEFLRGAITNNGLFEASGTGSTFDTGRFAKVINDSAGTLTGGTWDAVGGGVLAITGGAITTDAASIGLNGAGSVFEAGNGTSFTTIQQSLATIASGGSLSFAAGYAFAGGMSGPFTNNGTLTMSGSGTSTIGTSLTSSGTINVAGGTLSVAGTVSLSGTLNVYTPPVAGVSAGTFSSGLITATAASTIAIGIGSGIVTSSLTDAGTVSVSTFAALTFTGASDTFSGAIKTIANGVGGTVAFAAGSDMLAKGASLALGTTAVSGAIVTLGTSLTDKGKLALSSGTLALGGYAFAVGSGSTLSGGTLSGTGTSTEGVLQAQGATTLSGLTVSGARLTNFGTLTETGTLALAGASGIIDAEINQKGATWNLSDNAAVTLTGAATDTFSNVGTLQKTTGTGKAVVGVAVANTGTINAASGTLDLASTVAGTGTETIGAAGILELGKAIAATQALTFSGVGGQLLLDDAHDFHAGVTGFAHGDTMDLSTFGTSGEKFTYTPSGSGTTSGGTLAITSGTNTASIALHGTYTANQFHLASDGHGGTSVTYG